MIFKDYIELLDAQSRLETNNFKSKSATMAYNLFGMKKSKKRFKYWIGEYLEHSSYMSVIMSVGDRMDWDMYHKINWEILSPEEYIDRVVSKGYAEDKKYKTKWLKIYNQWRLLQ